jgi:putative endopeptidase
MTTDEIEVDKNIRPQDDMDKYVNSIWKNNNQIPDDYNRWGSFEILSIENEKKLKNIVETEFTNKDEHMLNILYNQGIDEKRLNLLKPIDVLADRLVKIDKYNLNKYFIESIKSGFSLPFSLSVHTDLKDSNSNVIYLSPSGISLPDRDYYFLDNKQEIREQYKEFLDKFSELTQIQFKSSTVYEIEERLASKMMSRVEKRDPHKIYNLFNFDEVKTLVSYIDFDTMFDVLNLPKDKKIIVTNPNFFKELQNMFTDISEDKWKEFFRWKLLSSASSYLDDKTKELSFDFYGKKLSDLKEMKPRWKRVLSTVQSALGELLGKLYVTEHFPEDAKDKAMDMIIHIKNELRNRINKSEWMTDETKLKALDKMESFGVKIGHPDKWKSYDDLSICNDNHWFDNLMLCNEWELRDEFSKIHKPVDKMEWHMNPQDVNAYYSPTVNEIVFPAGILQKPFFSKDYDPALNFGGIGTVIGHEMTHGFDDKGRLYDKNGNLNNWWTDKDSENYKECVTKLIDQFNGCSVCGEKVNGELTIGENIADLGGLTISYNALMNYLKDKDVNIKEQKERIFLAYSRIWRCNIREKELLNRLITDPHSPPHLRVNQIIKNMPEFREVFNVKEGDQLYLNDDECVKVW